MAIDLNAVPPLGIEGIEVGDKGFRDGVFCYGAPRRRRQQDEDPPRAINKLFKATPGSWMPGVYDLAAVM